MNKKKDYIVLFGALPLYFESRGLSPYNPRRNKATPKNIVAYNSK
jgi:hypothetical protein